MGKQVPAARAVAVVVEPGAEDEVGGNCEEEAGTRLAFMYAHVLEWGLGTHMMKNQPKKPQWLPPSTGGASSQAYSVRHSRRRVWTS